MTSVILSSNQTPAGRFQGVAPGANVVAVRAFESDGSGQYLDVIKGLDWIVANKDVFGIRVLNLSFSGDAVALYWEDPLNQAVMATWQAGIVVVAAAGNAGPAAMTIGVPGNVPYIITVGAMTDNYTPSDPTDDELASFSSAGPTYEGHLKPLDDEELSGSQTREDGTIIRDGKPIGIEADGAACHGFGTFSILRFPQFLSFLPYSMTLLQYRPTYFVFHMVMLLLLVPFQVCVLLLVLLH